MMKRFVISSHETLKEALRRLNSLPGNAMTLFVADDDNRICGTLTDGDIRRAIISGASLDSRVADACHTPFRFVDPGVADVTMLRECRNKGITLLPRLDADGRLVGIVDLNVTHTLLPVRAVLMAGGKGERLRPMTLTTPKPLLKVDGKAIIDYNIEALAACGIDDITVTTRYLAEKIYEHFATPVAGVLVKCITEEAPLGTAGALSLLDTPTEGSTILMNSDLLTTISFEELYERHETTGADITVAVIPYQISVPYAIVATEDDRVTAIEEKPSYSYFANAGIYMIRNRVIAGMVRGAHIDATDLIETVMASGGLVSYYPINGTWIDVGSPVDFNHAAELMRHHRNLVNKN